MSDFKPPNLNQDRLCHNQKAALAAAGAPAARIAGLLRVSQPAQKLEHQLMPVLQFLSRLPLLAAGLTAVDFDKLKTGSRD